MNLRKIVPALLVVAALGWIADSATGETIDIKGHSPKEVKDGCDGTYFSPSKKYGVYGCVNSGGGGIVCGGTGKDKKSCDTFKTAPPHLPNRTDIRKAEKPSKTQ